MGDAEGGGDDVEIHDGFRDEEGYGCAIQTKGASQEVAGDAGKTGTHHIVGGESLVLVC